MSPSAMARPHRFDVFWSRVGQQLRQPEGWAGTVIGRLMVWLNATPNRAALKALDVKPGDDVLEVGFGPGAALSALLRTGPRRLCGLDPSKRMVEAAHRRFIAAMAAGTVEIAQGALPNLPWQDGSFDRILLVNVIYFLDCENGDLSCLWRALRPGGRLVVYATDRSAMMRWPFAGTDTHRLVTARDVTTALATSGFDPRKIRSHVIVVGLNTLGFVIAAER